MLFQEKKNHTTKITVLIILIVSLVFVFSCKQKEVWQTHESGLRYRVIKENKEGSKPKMGDILLLKMRYITDNDSILFDSRDIQGAYRMQLKEASHPGGSIEDAFSILKIGDSIQCTINAKAFYENTRHMDVPDNVNPDSYLNFFIKLSGIQSVNDLKAERQAKYHENKIEEEALLEHYLKISNITVEPTLSGLYYIEEKAGTGKKAQAGHKVTVHYTGKLIDGMVFDSSYDRHKPFTFMLGAGLVIQGWEEGISKMREGGKAQLIIPSALAYGERGNSRIAPYSTLIFDVELIKVD